LRLGEAQDAGVDAGDARGTAGAPGAARTAETARTAEAPRTAEAARTADQVARFFDGSPRGLVVCEAVGGELALLGPFEVRVGRSQVAFRRRRGFAWLWRPSRWLRNPSAEVVLSFALREPVESGRLKQVVNPSPRTWMHHLEVHDVADLDDEVRGWLRRAFDEAG
jgi:hypothetical protein